GFVRDQSAADRNLRWRHTDCHRAQMSCWWERTTPWQLRFENAFPQCARSFPFLEWGTDFLRWCSPAHRADLCCQRQPQYGGQIDVCSGNGPRGRNFHDLGRVVPDGESIEVSHKEVRPVKGNGSREEVARPEG